MKYFILLLLLIASSCQISSPFGDGNSNNSSITDQLCSNTDFGPVPRSMNKTLRSKVYLDSPVKNETQLMAVVDIKCLGNVGLKSLDKITNIKADPFRKISRQKRKLYLEAVSVKIAAGVHLQEFEEKVNKEPCVLAVQIDKVLEKFTAPNDPLYSQTDHLAALNMELAWSVFFGTGGITQDVVLAVVDDGGDTDHPDLITNVWTNTGEVAGNSIDDDGNGYIDDINGYNFASDIGDPNHELTAVHGTKVSGVAAAGYNNSIGTTGIMGRNIKIMHLNAGGSGTGIQTLAGANAIIYAVNNGADVINLSWGGTGENPGLKTILEQAVGAGAFIAIAAGNSTLNIDSTFISPAGYGSMIEGAMAVGSIDSTTGTLSLFSNFGPSSVELFAPGAESSTVGLLTPTPGSSATLSYDRSFGTSFSSPIVAAAAALAIGYLRSHGGVPTPAEIETLIKDSSSVTNTLAGKGQGCRVLDISEMSSQL